MFTCLIASLVYRILLPFHTLARLDSCCHPLLTSRRMNNTTCIAGSSPKISYQLSKAEGIAFSSVFIMASFFIVAGNFLTIVLFALSKKLRKRSLILVMNMAVSDLLLGAVSLPIYIYGNADYFRLGKVKTNQDLFFSYIFLDAIFSQVSLISALSISLERFHAICWPFRHRVLSMRTYKIVFFLPGQLLSLLLRSSPYWFG